MKDLYANNWLFTVLGIDRDLSLTYLQISQNSECVDSIIFFYVVEFISSKMIINRNNSIWEINSIALKC